MSPGKPTPPPAGELTHLLQAWSHGDAEARDRLLPIVYNELRRAGPPPTCGVSARGTP